MGAVVTSTGSGSFGRVADWSINESVTPVLPNNTSASVGDLSITVVRNDDTDLAVDNDITLSHPTLGEAKGRVHTVSMQSNKLARLDADSVLGRFISGAYPIPGVESGAPASALDLVMQMSGWRGCTDTNTATRYWSLAGHSAGFDAAGALVQPSGTDQVFENRNSSIYVTGRERVPYMEIVDFATIDNLGADGFPRKVLGGTPRLRRARTYVKFKLAASTASNTTTFSFGFGPQFRQFVLSPAMRQNTMKVVVTLAQTGSTDGTLTASITTQNTSAADVVTTATTGAVAALARTGEVTVAIETYINTSGAIVARVGGISAAGTATAAVTATSPVTTGNIAPGYTRQWTASSTAATSTIKHLAVREGALDTDQWANWFTHNYTAAPAFTNQLASSHAGSPIAATNSELWDYLKQVAVARRVEIAATPAGIVLREQRANTVDLTRKITAQRTISTAVQGRNIDITNLSTKAISTGKQVVFDATSAYTVGFGESKTFDVTVPDGVRFLYSPRPWYNETAVNGISLDTTYYSDAATIEEFGTYYVSGKDNYPIAPLQWLDYGGSLTARVVDGVGKLTLTGPLAPIPGVPGPYRISQSDGSVDHPVLRVVGVGVTSTPSVVTVPTGADPTRTNVDKAGSIQNIGLGSLGEVYDAAAWAMQLASGPTVTLSFAIGLRELAEFGIGPGSIVTFERATFRVDAVRVSAGVANCSAVKMTTVGEFQSLWTGKTVGDFATATAGTTALDFAIRPLEGPPVAAPPTGTAPAITLEPVTSYIATTDTTHTFTAAASGTPAPTVQWQWFIDPGTGSVWVDIAGKTSTTLTLTETEYQSPPGATQRAGGVRAVFTNTGGTATTSIANAYVETPVVITVQPTNQSVAAGANVTFTLTKTGTSTLTTWEKSTDGGTTWTVARTAFSVTPYTHTALIGENGDKYRAIVANHVSTVTSNIVTLTVT